MNVADLLQNSPSEELAKRRQQQQQQQQAQQQQQQQQQAQHQAQQQQSLHNHQTQPPLQHQQQQHHPHHLPSPHGDRPEHRFPTQPPPHHRPPHPPHRSPQEFDRREPYPDYSPHPQAQQHSPSLGPGPGSTAFLPPRGPHAPSSVYLPPPQPVVPHGHTHPHRHDYTPPISHAKPHGQHVPSAHHAPPFSGSPPPSVLHEPSPMYTGLPASHYPQYQPGPAPSLPPPSTAPGGPPIPAPVPVPGPPAPQRWVSRPDVNAPPMSSLQPPPPPERERERDRGNNMPHTRVMSVTGSSSATPAPLSGPAIAPGAVNRDRERERDRDRDREREREARGTPMTLPPGSHLEDERERDRLEGKVHHRDRDRERERGRVRPHHPPFPAPPPPLPPVREPRPRLPATGVPPSQGGRPPMELDHERERDINYERMRQRERERERDRERDRERERDPREKEAHQRDGMGYIHPIGPAAVPRKPDDGSSHVGYPYAQVPGPSHPDPDVHHPHAPPPYEHTHGNPYPQSHSHAHQHQHLQHGHHPTHPPPDMRAPPLLPPQNSGVRPHPDGHGHGHTHSRPRSHTHQHPNQHQHPHQHQLQHQHPHPHQHPHQHQHVHARSHIPTTGAHHPHGLVSRARPVAPPVHLGAFVHPFGPLPLPRNRTVAQATLYIPALALPRVRPTHPRVWGSGPYTDDSDIISAAVHAGRVRWSEVSEARRRGQDARVEVKVVPAAERYFGSMGAAPEPGPGGDPADDGRGFSSAGWGNGHEGAGIEILDVTFWKGGTAHRAPGLGRQNRKQRLGEYAAERGAVLGFAASAAASGAVGGRTKRARGVGVGGSGVPDSDETDEDGMESDEIEEEEDEEDMDVDALAARVTIVFEGGRGGALPGFKYEPDALREAVLQRRQLLLPSGAASVSPRMRKRQRVDDEVAMDMDAGDPGDAGDSGSLLPLPRGVELETAVERFLLRMYDAGVDADADAAETDGTAEGVTEDGGADKQLLQAEGTNDRRRWEIWLLGTLDNDNDAEKDGDRLPLAASLHKPGAGVPLQRGLRAENLEFVEGEVRVLQDTPVGGDSETSSGTREGWAIEVRRWRWA